ncbi:MAG: hypothetical protein ACLGSA_04085 [Acidobacteriota bacterium]
MSTLAARPALTPADLALERRKLAAQSFIADARRGLEAMREALEPATGSGSLEAISPRNAVLDAILGLDALLRGDDESPSNRTTERKHGLWAGRFTGSRTRPTVLRSPALTAWTDLESLQRFRRAAIRDLDRLERELAKRQARQWHSGADENRQRAMRRECLRWGACLGLAVVLLAGWWGWQRSRQEATLIRLNSARVETAAQAVRLISMAGGLAQKTRGRPLADIVPDMSGPCAGIDVQKTMPDHPCRAAWAMASHAIFRAAVPPPGRPLDAPSEVFSDPWGAPYVLLIPESGPPRPPHVVSAGPDGFIGTGDDVSADIPAWSPSQPN